MSFLINKFAPRTESSGNSSTPPMDCTENPSKSLEHDNSADTADSVLRLRVNTSAPQQNVQKIPRAVAYTNTNSVVSLSSWNKKFGGNDSDNIGEVLSIEAPVDKIKKQHANVAVSSPSFPPKLVFKSTLEIDMHKEKKEVWANIEKGNVAKLKPITSFLPSSPAAESPQHGLLRCNNCGKKLRYPTGACVVVCVCRTVIQVKNFRPTPRHSSSSSSTSSLFDPPSSKQFISRAPSRELSADLLPPSRQNAQPATNPTQIAEDPEEQDTPATDTEGTEEEQALKQLLGNIMNGQPEGPVRESSANKVAREDVTVVTKPRKDSEESAAKLDELFKRKNFMQQPLKRRLRQYDGLLRKELLKRQKKWDKNSGTQQELEELWVARKQQLRRFGLYAQLLPVFEQMQMVSQLRWEQIQRLDRRAGEILAARLQEIAALSKTIDAVAKKQSVFRWGRKKEPDPPALLVQSSFFSSVEELLERDNDYGALVTFLEDLDQKLIDAAAAVKECEPQMGKKSRAQRSSAISEAISSRAEAQRLWHSKRLALMKLDHKPSTPIKFYNGTADLKLCPSRASEQAMEDAQLKFNSIVLDERFPLGKDFAGVKKNIQKMSEPPKPASILGVISWFVGIISTQHFKGCLGEEDLPTDSPGPSGNVSFGSRRHSLRTLSESLVLQDPLIHRICMAMYFEEPELQKLDAMWQKNVMWLRELSPAKLGVKPRFMPRGSRFRPVSKRDPSMLAPEDNFSTPKKHYTSANTDTQINHHGSGLLPFRSQNRRQNFHSTSTSRGSSGSALGRPRIPYTAATVAFNKFGSAMYRGPYDMMERLLEAFTMLQLEAVEVATANGKRCDALGAEDILPLVIFSLLHSSFNRMNTALQFAEHFGYVQDSSWEPTDGEAGYFLVTLNAAVSWITSQDQEKGVESQLEMTPSPEMPPSAPDTTPPPPYTLSDPPPPTYHDEMLSTPNTTTVASTTAEVDNVAISDTPEVKFTVIDTPGVKLNSIDTPAVEVTNVDTPGVAVSSNDTPRVDHASSDAPSNVSNDTPGVETPGPDAPDVVNIDTPGVEIPVPDASDIVSIDTPGVDLTGSPIPDVLDLDNLEEEATMDSEKTIGIDIASTSAPDVVSIDTPGVDLTRSGTPEIISLDTSPEQMPVADVPDPPAEPIASLEEVMTYVQSVQVKHPDREYNSPRSKVGGGVTLILIRVRMLVIAKFGEAAWQRYQSNVHDFFQNDNPGGNPAILKMMSSFSGEDDLNFGPVANGDDRPTPPSVTSSATAESPSAPTQSTLPPSAATPSAPPPYEPATPLNDTPSLDTDTFSGDEMCI